VLAGIGRRGRLISFLLVLVALCNFSAIARQPESPQVTPRAAAHFLEQATFGPTAADVAVVQSLGYAGWLEQQFQLPETTIADGLDVNQTRDQVFLNMANGLNATNVNTYLGCDLATGLVCGLSLPASPH